MSNTTVNEYFDLQIVIFALDNAMNDYIEQKQNVNNTSSHIGVDIVNVNTNLADKHRKYQEKINSFFQTNEYLPQWFVFCLEQLFFTKSKSQVEWYEILFMCADDYHNVIILLIDSNGKYDYFINDQIIIEEYQNLLKKLDRYQNLINVHNNTESKQIMFTESKQIMFTKFQQIITIYNDNLNQKLNKKNFCRILNDFFKKHDGSLPCWFIEILFVITGIQQSHINWLIWLIDCPDIYQNTILVLLNSSNVIDYKPCVHAQQLLNINSEHKNLITKYNEIIEQGEYLNQVSQVHRCLLKLTKNELSIRNKEYEILKKKYEECSNILETHNAMFKLCDEISELTNIEHENTLNELKLITLSHKHGIDIINNLTTVLEDTTTNLNKTSKIQTITEYDLEITKSQNINIKKELEINKYEYNSLQNEFDNLNKCYMILESEHQILMKEKMNLQYIVSNQNKTNDLTLDQNQEKTYDLRFEYENVTIDSMILQLKNKIKTYDPMSVNSNNTNMYQCLLKLKEIMYDDSIIDLQTNIDSETVFSIINPGTENIMNEIVSRSLPEKEINDLVSEKEINDLVSKKEMIDLIPDNLFKIERNSESVSNKIINNTYYDDIKWWQDPEPIILQNDNINIFNKLIENYKNSLTNNIFVHLSNIFGIEMDTNSCIGWYKKCSSELQSIVIKLFNNKNKIIYKYTPPVSPDFKSWKCLKHNTFHEYNIVECFSGYEIDDFNNNNIIICMANPILTVPDIYPSCEYCICFSAPDGSILKCCKICKKARYCSRKCQKNDWKSHRKECIGQVVK